MEMASSGTTRTAVELLDGWLGDSWSSCGDNADSTLSVKRRLCAYTALTRHEIPKLPVVRVAIRILEGE